MPTVAKTFSAKSDETRGKQFKVEITLKGKYANDAKAIGQKITYVLEDMESDGDVAAWDLKVTEV